MKLDSLEPNAHYDLAHGVPANVEKDNDGSTVVRINIVEEYKDDEESGEKVLVGWSCYEVRIWDKATKANAKKAFIRSVMDESQEFNLVNSYNKYVLGIETKETAVDDYKDWLQFTVDLGNALAFLDNE